MAIKTSNFNSIKDFYPFYLSEHLNQTNQKLHYLGTVLSLTVLSYIILTMSFHLILFYPLAGYCCAWTGHFFFEKNTPASFKYPVYCYVCGHMMFYELTRKYLGIQDRLGLCFN